MLVRVAHSPTSSLEPAAPPAVTAAAPPPRHLPEQEQKQQRRPSIAYSPIRTGTVSAKQLSSHLEMLKRLQIESLSVQQQREFADEERDQRADAALAALSAELDALYAQHDLRLVKPGFKNDDSFVFYDDAIRCASRERLLSLVGRSQLDDELRDMLIFAHPLFVDSRGLLAALVATFWLPAAQHTVDKYNERRGMSKADARRHAQLAVVRFLCHWFASWLGEFADETSPLSLDLERFVGQLRAADADAAHDAAERTAWAEVLESRLAGARAREAALTARAAILVTPPLSSKTLRFSSLLAIPAAELAQQWALLNAALLSQVRLNELCAGKWSTAGFAASVDRLSTWIDQRTFWIASEIVTEGNQSRRVATLAHFLSVAETSIELNDFMTLRAIYLALQLNDVARLKHTWAELPDEAALVWRTVSSIMDYDKNSHVYRLLLHERSPPFVPCPTVFLKDLLKHHEQAPDPAAPHLLSVVRLNRWAADVGRLRAAQLTPYAFDADTDIVDWLLHHAHVLSRADLRTLALRAESSSAEAPSTVARGGHAVAPVHGAGVHRPLRKLSSSSSSSSSASAAVLASASTGSLKKSVPLDPRRASSPDLIKLAVPSKCERCGKRAPDRRVDVNVKMCVCSKCFNELRKVTGPSLYCELLGQPSGEKAARSGLLSSLRRRSSKAHAEHNEESSASSDEESLPPAMRGTPPPVFEKQSSFSRFMPKSRRQQVRDEFASKVQAFAELAGSANNGD